MAIRVSELGNEAGSYRELDDRGLVLDFQAGEVAAYQEIFHRYRALAWSIAFRLLGSIDDAEEATQETMLRVYQGLPRFNGRYQLQAWVARIATNVSLDKLRARARRPQEAVALQDGVEDLQGGPGQDPFELVERVLEREKVLAVLDQLPEHHRRALVLREVEGRSHQEIGEALEISPAQAKALIHRAKGSFRRAWTGNGHRGLAALVPWLLFPMRVPNLLKRMLGTLGESTGGQVASQAVTQVAATTTASPAIAAATTSGVERLTATAMAVLMAGSVTAGVVAVRHGKSEQAKPSPSPKVVEVVVPLPAPEVQPRPTVAPEPKGKHRKKTKKQDKASKSDPEASPSVSVVPPADQPSGASEPDPTESSSAEPTAPAIGPAPDWDMTFRAGVPWAGSCADCPAAAWLMSSKVEGTAGGTVSIAQVAVGSALDSKGQPSWKAYVQYAGAAEGTTGRLDFQFKLGTDLGWYSYSGIAVLSSAAATADGGYDYTFVGPFHLDDGPGEEAVPVQGSIQFKLRFWGDGTSLYASDISLFEA